MNRAEKQAEDVQTAARAEIKRRKTTGANRTHCLVALPVAAIDEFMKTRAARMFNRALVLDEIEREVVNAGKAAAKALVEGWVKSGNEAQ